MSQQLMGAPLGLRRFVVWRAMQEAAGRRPVSFAHVQTVLELLTSDAARSIDMPGHSVQRLGPRLVLTRRRAGDRHRPRDARPNFFDYPLSIPGEVPVPQANCVLVAEHVPAGAFERGASKATRTWRSSGGTCTRDRGGSGTGVRATDSGRWAWAGRRSCRIFLWTGRCRGRVATTYPSSWTNPTGLSGWPGSASTRRFA